MKRAAFRLQPVLELRRTQERTAALAAAEAARAAAEADRRATEAETALSSALPVGRVDPGAFRAAMVLARVAAEDATSARALATASAEQADLVRAAWTDAAQRTKGLDRLRERHRDAVRLAEQAAEERSVDDLVTGRSGRRSAAGEVPWTD